jgi:hypothetical protein
MSRPITEKRKQRFLVALTECGNVTQACLAAAIGRQRVYECRHADPNFAKAWEEAESIAADRMEKEAWRRGVDGVPEPLVSAGRLICDPSGEPIMIPRYSDTLLAMLLKAHRPDKYKDRSEVQFDISDRLAERLEAARQRLVTKEQPVILDLKADEISE